MRRCTSDEQARRPKVNYRMPIRSAGMRTGQDTGEPEGGQGRSGATSLGRRVEPLASGEREVAGSLLVLPDCDNLVDGEVAVLGMGRRAAAPPAMNCADCSPRRA